MNFVESLRMFHIDAKEIPCVTEKGAPTEKTQGAAGVLYMDTDTGDLYKCRAADAVNEVYTWEKIGGSNSEYKLPIAGENLGGVKNGGNVVINEDGTMTAPVSDSSPNPEQAVACENLDLFYSALIRRKANPKEPLAITTYPGGGNQPTHPKVLYFPNGWKGHKYWMVYTPYPNNNNFEENPCVTYSDDGINWSEEGITNPIVRSEHQGCFYSDPHLVYIPDSDTLELWVRWCSNGTDGLLAGWEGVYRLKSTDGVNWSEKEYLHNVVDTGWASLLSPSAIYDEGKYKIWYCYRRECLKYYESADGTNWVHIRDISVNLTPLGKYKLWHFDMIKTDKGYEFVGCYQLNGAFNTNNYIAYSWSADNENFVPAVCVLANGESGRFDDMELYRPCLVKIGTKYRMYYGAQKDIRIWHIGVVETPNMNLLNELLSENTATTLPSYSGSGGGDSGDSGGGGNGDDTGGGDTNEDPDDGDTVSPPAPVIGENVSATYVASEHGASANSWTEANGGDNATVYGGTWGNEYIKLDGKDDRIVVPVTNSSEIRFVMRTEQTRANGGLGYLFDCRTALTAYLFSGDPVNCIGGCNVYVNGSNVNNFEALATGEWVDVRIVLDSPLTGNMVIGSKYTAVEYLCCDIASIVINSTPTNVSEKVESVAEWADATLEVGYVGDGGTIENTLNMHHSTKMPCEAKSYKLTVDSSVTNPYLRFAFYDADGNYIGYDKGKGLNVDTGSQSGAHTIVTSAPVGNTSTKYFSVNVNTSDKNLVSVSKVTYE